MLTKQQITERMAALEADREQLLANLNAVVGAIQNCKFFLDLLEKQPATVHLVDDSRS